MPRFVVHEHHATRLHWDLRLEIDGVLKSWAVPKEPSGDSAVKRLAIEVDDHDLEYLDFEGDIKEGYGAGKVKIWDSGTYELIDRKKNKLIVSLNGKKLKGDFVLLRFEKAGEKEWLFMKK